MNRNRKIAAAVLIGAAALVYGISPFDLAPEAVLGPLGLLDDAGVLIGAGIWIFNLLKGRKPGTGTGGVNP
ncbi:hypothetical protein BH11ACT3_BH11ACT3_04360 [soil metagenome]